MAATPQPAVSCKKVFCTVSRRAMWRLRGCGHHRNLTKIITRSDKGSRRGGNPKLRLGAGLRQLKYRPQAALGRRFQSDFATIKLREIANDRQPQARSRDLFIQAFADPEYDVH